MISIVLPTLNEAGNITKLVGDIEQVLRKNNLKAELIIVDDDSEDRTAQITRDLNKKYGNIRTLVRHVRDGAGAAHWFGYKSAKGDVVIAMEADNSCDAEDIPKIAKKISEGWDIVVASRYAKGASTNKSLANKAISRLGNVFISIISGIQISDFTIAYRGFRREIADKINCVEKDGNPLLMEFILKAKNAGYAKITEIPTHYRERVSGVSKNKLMKAIPRTFKAAVRISIMGK
ncbi:MAG: glycosyltransferase [Candidatus Aenigmarchaeota archaeon]|nr:glycosyltransferase [Candidatus Aenigmarchaeota archaeon]